MDVTLRCAGLFVVVACASGCGSREIVQGNADSASSALFVQRFTTNVEGRWTLSYEIPRGRDWTWSPPPRSDLPQVSATQRVAGAFAPTSAFDLKHVGGRLFAMAVEKVDDGITGWDSVEAFQAYRARERARKEEQGWRYLLRPGAVSKVELDNGTWMCGESVPGDGAPGISVFACQSVFGRLIVHAYVNFPEPTPDKSAEYLDSSRRVIEMARSLRFKGSVTE